MKFIGLLECRVASSERCELQSPPSRLARGPSIAAVVGEYPGDKVGSHARFPIDRVLRFKIVYVGCVFCRMEQQQLYSTIRSPRGLNQDGLGTSSPRTSVAAPRQASQVIHARSHSLNSGTTVRSYLYFKGSQGSTITGTIRYGNTTKQS